MGSNWLLHEGDMLRKTLITMLAVAAAACLSACPPKQGQSTQGVDTADAPLPPLRTNIVLIVADDLGYGDLSCYGAKDIRTPTLDALAAAGVRYTQFYANGPECTPTRTALLTGRYQQRVGGLECAIGTDNIGRYDDAIALAEKHELGLPVSRTTIMRLLKDGGYNTGLFGKWHLGYEPQFSPMWHGFDMALYVEGGNCDYFMHQEETGRDVLRFDGQLIKDRHGQYLTQMITDHALAFLDQQDPRQKGPFFLYVPYTAPHFPLQGPNDYDGKLHPKETWNQGPRSKYVELVEYMDGEIARLLARIDEKGWADNTLVIFISDNGGVKDQASNGPLRGHKGGLFEGGIREPCIVRWPGKLKPGRVLDDVTMTFDLTASMARVGGVKPPADQPFDGLDMLGFAQRGQPVPDRDLYWRARRGDRTWRAVRSHGLKYLSMVDDKNINEYLFDLQNDPAERDNLMRTKLTESVQMKRMLTEWEAQVKAER
jgi:arylsulfatase A-like enzyme